MLGAFEAALHRPQTLTNDDFASNLTVEQLDEKIELFEAEQKELRESDPPASGGGPGRWGVSARRIS